MSECKESFTRIRPLQYSPSSGRIWKKGLWLGFLPGFVGTVSDADGLLVNCSWSAKNALYTKSSKTDQCLLLVDRHSTHYSWSEVNFCKERGTKLVSLHVHSTYKLEPLNIAYFKLLKTAYLRVQTILLDTGKNSLTICKIFYKFVRLYCCLIHYTFSFFLLGSL